MRRYNENNDYQHYSYLPSASKTASRNSYYQYYDRRLRSQNTMYSHTTPIPIYGSPRSQYQSQSSIIISDLAEPISAFHDIQLPPYHQHRVGSLPVVYKPQSVSRYSSTNDERIARVSAMRERLLRNIQQNINEIDEELSSLKRRPSQSNHIPYRLTPLVNIQSTSAHRSVSSLNEENQNWPNKTKKVYQVVPRIQSNVSKTLSVATPKVAVNLTSDSFIGEYHYGPEVDEIEIQERDPENIDLNSNYDEISRFNFHETFSPSQFIRDQSDISQNRALISVPEYVDNYNIQMNESAEEFNANNHIDTNSARPSTVTSVHDSALIGKLNVQDFQTLIKTAPEEKIEIPPEPQIELPSESIHHAQEVIEERDPNVINTILSKPMRHSRLSMTTQDTISITSQTKINHDNNAINNNYFFSDFGNEFEGEEDLISIDPYNFAPPTNSEIISEENKSNSLRRQSQTSILNPYASQQHQHVENNNHYVDETEKKKIDETMKQSFTAISTPPSIKMRLTSIDGDTQTKFEKHNNNSDENQRQTLTASPLYMNLNEQSDNDPSHDLSIGLHSSLSTSQQKLSNRISSQSVIPNDERSRSGSNNSDLNHQRSSSLRRSSQKQFNDLLSREQSYISLSHHDEASIQIEHDLDNHHQNTIGTYLNSEIPVPLTSPELNGKPASPSRTASPLRRNSISSIDQTALFTSDDILDLDNTTKDNPQAIFSEQPHSEHEKLSSPTESPSLQENQHNHNAHNDTYELQHELSLNPNLNELDDHKSSISSLAQNHYELIDENPLRSSSSHSQDEIIPLKSSLSSSNRNSDELKNHNSSPPSSDQNASGFAGHRPSRLSSYQSQTGRIDHDSAQLSSNKNHDEHPNHESPRPSSNQHQDVQVDQNSLRPSSHQDSGDLADRNPSRLSPNQHHDEVADQNHTQPQSTQNSGDLVDHNSPRLVSNQNPDRLIDQSRTHPSLHQNSDGLVDRNSPRLSPNQHQDEVADQNHTQPQSTQNSGDLVDHNSPRLVSNQNQDELIDQSRTHPSLHQNSDGLVDHNSSRLASNNNQDVFTHHHHHHHHHPSSSTALVHEQEHNRLNSVSPIIMEIKKIENDDLHLTSPSPRHSDISDTKLTSVGREDTFRQPTSPDYANSQTEKPASRSSKSKLGFDNELRDDSKNNASSSRLFLTQEPPLITESQRRSKLSLLVRGPRIQQNNITRDENLQTETGNFTSINSNKKSKQQQQQHVTYADNSQSSQTRESNDLKNWRERINAILSKNRSTNNRYSHVPSRVNSFGNFEYQPKKILILPKRKSRKKITSNYEMDSKENKLKKVKDKSEREIVLYKEPPAQVLGKLLSLPDGKAKIFSEKLKWNRKSKIRSYSLENLHYKPQQSHQKIFNKKPKWHSESKLSELIKTNPRRQFLKEVDSLKSIPDKEEPPIYYDEAQFETKIFDINSSIQPLILDITENSTDDVSYDFKHRSKLIFHRKLIWRKESKLKDTIWKNIDYTPKQSEVKIFHQAVHWNSESRLRITHSLNLGTQERLKYWSEIDLPRLKEKKALFSQYYDSKWNDIITDNIETTIKANPLIEKSNLTDYIEENSNDRLQNENDVESPANRPKWNAVSKSRSVNLIYNPKITNATTVGRGWDLELRRKRAHRLPPLKRKRDHDKTTELTLEEPPSNHPLAIEYHDNHSLATDQIANIDYGTLTSSRSSRALVPLRHVPNLDLSYETPRSQRPIQQEWYDEMSKSRLTHRTEMGRTTHNSFRDSVISVHQTHTPRELQTLRSSTRNSQNSVMSGTLLDSSIRTNRATELRLSKDMDEYHQHSHDPHQSMPIEIRGFRLDGTQLSVPDNATIRPLSNISYRASERVKHRRAYPWSTLHPHGTPSRNSSLLPIAEYRHPSFQTSIVETPQLVQEE